MILISFLSRLAALLVWLLFLCFSLYAQVVETIEANPNVHTLHSIWKITGVNSEDRVGSLAGSLGDISGDGLGDWAVADARSGAWKVYFGGSPVPDTVPDWRFEGATGSLSYPVVGNFYGTGEKVVAFARDTCNDNSICFFRLYFFKAGNGTIEETPSAVLNTGIQFCVKDAIAADLDNDGDDELILTRSCSFPEIWIYEGGEDFLQSHQPTLLIADRDNNSIGSSRYSSAIVDLNSDHLLDLITVGSYNDYPRMKFWLGSETSPWDWDLPDRVIDLRESGIDLDFIVAHFDGDSIPDFAGTVYQDDTRLIHLYLSRSGKQSTARSFAREDAEKVLRTTLLRVRARVGFVNDKSHRYEVLPLIGPSLYHANEPMMVLFSGGKLGPNNTWDAYYSPSSDGVTPGGVFQYIHPLLDVDGNGWDDFLTSDSRWFGFNHGIAMVIAGGPEIPNDDPTVSVEEVATEEHGAALHIWPNPVKEDLHIAWRGDLKRMPHRFAVHDEVGRLVAEGSVEPGVGAARWRCGNVSSGMYLLTVFDKEDRMIASTRFIKTE